MTTKYSFLFLAILISNFSFSQLDPKGKYDEPKGFKQKSYNFFMSKRLAQATDQRDSLHELNIAFNKDTTERGIQYRHLDSLHNNLIQRHNKLNAEHNKLNADYREMNDRYTELIKSSLSRTEQLNQALREKGEQLLAREKRLAELEAIIRKQDSITNALNDLVKRALLSFKSDELTVEMKNGKVYVSMSDKLLFKSGSADVEEKGRDAIKKLAEVLNKNTDIDIMVEGHTDNVPIKTAVFKDNWDLSVARSTNIVRLLTDNYGVSPLRLTASGRGEFVPRATNDNAEGRARNRRTEIILSPKLDELFKLIGN
ncbi:MAG: OmpA family protein [Bacteroidia bacterium]